MFYVPQLVFSPESRPISAVSLRRLTVHHVTLVEAFIERGRLVRRVEVFPNVVLQVPGLVLIVHHEEQSKLLFHISPLPVGALPSQSARPANDQRPQETAVQVLGARKITVRSASFVATGT